MDKICVIVIKRTMSMKISYSDRDYTFGQAVLKLRSKIGLTQERLGKLLGISGRAISEWETGSSYPKAERLKALIELAVQYQAFPPEHEAEEIHVLWKAAHQKVLLDGHWLCLLLSWRSSPSPRVEPEALEETRSSISPPLLDVGLGANPIGANVGVGIGTREGHRKGADEADGGCRDGACPRPYGPLPSEAPAQTMAGQFLHRREEDRDKTRLETDKMRERHKWLLANLIALI